MAIKGKTILLGPAYCKQGERKVERVRDAVWRGVEDEVSRKERRMEGEKGGRVLRSLAYHILFALQILSGY